MSNSTVINVAGVWKEFRIYDRPVDRLLESIARQKRHKVFTALRGVNLQIRAGETVGIVGRNGSGKSTLLQLIAGTLHATQGEVTVRGRVAALLELGSGFNPDFSGRENVYLNGQVLGLRRQDVEARFDRIAAFADIGDFIDQPVRTYSSGMMVRLAFAVAINTDPDILIIDEALAVGDEAFQRKCFARIEEIKQAGSTILFVSHTASAVMNLCEKAVLLDAGEVLMEGTPKDVLSRYQRLLHSPEHMHALIREQIAEHQASSPSGEDVDVVSEDEGMAVQAGLHRTDVSYPPIGPWPIEPSERFDAELRSESIVEYVPEGARIIDAHFLNDAGRRVNVLMPGKAYVFRYRVEFESDADLVEFGMTIKSLDGVTLFGMSSHGRHGFLSSVGSGESVDVEFRFESRFQPGIYFLNVGVQGAGNGAGRRFLHRIMDATCFRVEAATSDRYMTGFYDLSAEPSVCWEKVPR